MFKSEKITEENAKLVFDKYKKEEIKNESDLRAAFAELGLPDDSIEFV